MNATEQGSVRLPILTAHRDVYDGVGAARHADEHVAGHVQLWGQRGETGAWRVGQTSERSHTEGKTDEARTRCHTELGKDNWVLRRRPEYGVIVIQVKRRRVPTLDCRVTDRLLLPIMELPTS